jgi:hypothetical protein
VPLTLRIEPALVWAVVQGSRLRRQLDGLDAEAVERVGARFQAAIDVETVDATILVGLGRAAAS